MDPFYEKIKLLASSFVDKGLTLSLAESCTGGMISSRITDIPGSSSFFLGSVVTYSNISKTSVLGVDENILKRCGAVSAETAENMASGVRHMFSSDIAASVTGIAGPSGGSAEKPVGLVYIAVDDGDTLHSVKEMFSGTREEIRKAAADALVSKIIQMVKI